MSWNRLLALTNFKDGGWGVGGWEVRQKFIFYTQKTTTSEFVYQKNYYFLAYPKNPLVFFSQPKKIPASFIDPKKSLLAKISDPKKSLGPPPPPSLKYVSGSPGVETYFSITVFFIVNDRIPNAPAVLHAQNRWEGRSIDQV